MGGYDNISLKPCRNSKEIIWHFTCDSCSGWWSIAASEAHPQVVPAQETEWYPKVAKKLFCPHCGEDQVIDEDTGYTGIM